jgi:hypothetical protein
MNENKSDPEQPGPTLTIAVSKTPPWVLSTSIVLGPPIFHASDTATEIPTLPQARAEQTEGQPIWLMHEVAFAPLPERHVPTGRLAFSLCLTEKTPPIEENPGDKQPVTPAQYGQPQAEPLERSAEPLESSAEPLESSAEPAARFVEDAAQGAVVLQDDQASDRGWKPVEQRHVIEPRTRPDDRPVIERSENEPSPQREVTTAPIAAPIQRSRAASSTEPRTAGPTVVEPRLAEDRVTEPPPVTTTPDESPKTQHQESHIEAPRPPSANGRQQADEHGHARTDRDIEPAPIDRRRVAARGTQTQNTDRRIPSALRGIVPMTLRPKPTETRTNAETPPPEINIEQTPRHVSEPVRRSEPNIGLMPSITRQAEPAKALDIRATPVRPDPTTSAKTTLEPETKSPVLTQPTRQISLKLASPDSASVDVQLREKGGRVHVAVRTPDVDLSKSLQTDLNDLVGRLENKGFKTESWIPPVRHAAAAAEPSGQRNDQGHSQQNSGSWHGQSQERQGRNGSNQRQQPRWMAEFEQTLSGEEKSR